MKITLSKEQIYFDVPNSMNFKRHYLFHFDYFRVENDLNNLLTETDSMCSVLVCLIY